MLDCHHGLATMNDLDDCEFEFQAQACVEESLVDFPLNLWGTNMVTEDASPLLPNNHSHSFYLPPVTRKQAIEAGRKEAMEMTRHMPESSYELSLKDMVDQQHEAMVQEESCFKHKSIHLETESLIKKQMDKKKKNKVGPISRSGSMDTDRFLLKMMIPTPSCLSFKKKTRADNSSKVSPRPFCEGSEKPLQKQGWIKRIFVPENHKISNNMDSNNSNTGRRANRSNSLPGCWLIFLSKKSKAKKQAEFII